MSCNKKQKICKNPDLQTYPLKITAYAVLNQIQQLHHFITSPW